MKYALLIHLPEGVFEQLHASEKHALAEKHRELQHDARQAKQFGGAVRLAPTQTATSVRTRGHEQIVTDGVYAETKEHLVGFYLLDCESLDQAIAYARRIPVGSLGTIEIRPVAWLDLADLTQTAQPVDC